MQINIVARSWLAYEISGSAFALGIVALARGLPMSILSLLGGAVADRSNKRNLLIIVQFSLSGLAIINALLVHLDIVRVWHLALIGLMQGVIFAFNMPARQALIPEVVGDKMLSNALALNSTGMNMNRVVAPAVAGILIASHPAVAFDVVAVLYIASGFLLFLLPKTDTSANSKAGNAFSDIADGLKYLFANKKLLIILVMAFMLTIIGMPYRQLLPVFQQIVLNVGPSMLGIMYTVTGIGALIGSLTVASLSPATDKRFMQGMGGIAFGVSLALFAMSSNFPLSLFLLTIIGLVGQGYMTINSILMMESTDSAYYGRVMSVYMLTFSMSPVAMLPIGYLVDRFGVSRTEMTAGIILTIVMTTFFGLKKRMFLSYND